MDLEVIGFQLGGEEEAAALAHEGVQVGVEVEMDLFAAVAGGMAEDVGEGLAVGVAELVAVGGNDVMVAMDQVHELVARVVQAAVVRDLHVIDPERMLLGIALAAQVIHDIVRVAVAQHQDAEAVAAQDDGDAGGVRHLRIGLLAGRFRAVLGQLFKGRDDRHRPCIQRFGYVGDIHFRHHFLLLADGEFAPVFRGRNHFHAREREFPGDALDEVVPPGEAAVLADEVQHHPQLHRLQGAARAHADEVCRAPLLRLVLRARVLGAIGPDFPRGELLFLLAGLDVLDQAADVVVVIVRQEHQVGRADFVQLGLQDASAAVRAAVDDDDAMVLSLVALDDEGVAVFHGQEVDFAHSNSVMLQI